MLKPATVPSPEVGKLSPQRILIAVVFPAPFAPRKPKISPLQTSKEMSFTAANEPNVLTRCEISIVLMLVSIIKTVL